MKWFKHPTNFSSHNPQITQLINVYGMEGYGRFNVLLEHLVFYTENMIDAPKVSLPPNRWAEILHVKLKTLKPFLETLQILSIIKLEYSKNLILVELANYREILSDRALSSKSRAATGSPRLDKCKELPNKRTTEQRQKETASNSFLALAAESSPEAMAAYQALITKGVAS